MSEYQEFWFASRTRKDQELAIRDSLKKLNVEYFLPTQVTIRQLKYRRKKVEVPIIRNLIFVRATKERACSLANDYGIQLFYMRNYLTHSMLIVPDKQMQDFMFVMNTDPEAATIDTEPLQPGEKVQVVKGEFAGIEGEMISVANRTHVVIRILDLLAVKIKIPKSYLKKIC